jgi:hypothetical protein
MLTVVARSESADENSGGVGRSRLDEIVRNAVNTLHLAALVYARMVFHKAKLLGRSTDERST